MSRDAAVLMVSNRFLEESDEEFAATIDGLRLELAPTTIFESIWVEKVLESIKHLRNSSLDETDDSPTDSRWLRFRSMAERSLNNAVNRLDRLRREAARAAREAPSSPRHQPRPAVAVVHPPADEAPPPPPPAPAVPTQIETPAAQPAPAQPAPSPTLELTGSVDQFSQLRRAVADTTTLDELMCAIDPALRGEFLEQFRDEVRAMLAEGVKPDEIVRGFPALTLDDVRAFQAGKPVPTGPRVVEGQPPGFDALVA